MRKINVLIVDDEEINLNLIEEIISEDHIDVFKETSGAEALETISKRDYAAVIIDINMPVMNGYELAKLLKKDPKAKDIPIIFITALHSKNEAYKAYKTGAIDFISKPIDPVVIKSKVDNFIQFYKTKKDLEFASNSKTNFLANMSHEIRTPLNSILGMAQIMSEDNLSKEQQNYMSIIQRAGKDLLSLINNILDLSKIESGELKLDKEEFSIDDILNNCIDLLTINARNKGLELYSDINPTVPDFVIGDPTRLKQILINLVTNAVKYTEYGNVSVNCTFEPNSNLLSIEVKDTGRGIPKDKKDYLFKNFFQVNPLMDKNKGFGLGLAITKNLIDLMKGEIKIESKQNEGSSFTIEIPVAVAKKSFFKKGSLKDKNVLLINFSEKFLKISRDIFTDMGATTFLSTNLDEAQEEIKKNSYHLIFYFWNYTKENCPKVKEAFKNNTTLKEKTLFLLDTSIDAEMPPSKISLRTPLKRSELRRYSHQIVNKKSDTKERPSQSTNKKDISELKGKILLVDDSEDSRLLIKIFLKNAKIELDVAMNGLEGLEKFKKNEYDIILMDVQMPEMDGLSCTKEIRKYEKQNPDKSKTFILAMTAYAFNEDIQRTRDAGCDSHISKPINKIKLISSLKKYMKS
ncbi:response regulator [Bacteriovoracales bacterium]|nr:response regulator [Bacteriovoracales bacterium]